MRASPRLVGYLTVHRVADNSMLEKTDPTNQGQDHPDQSFPGSENWGGAALGSVLLSEIGHYEAELGVLDGDGRFSDEHLRRMEEEGDGVAKLASRGEECSEEVT